MRRIRFSTVAVPALAALVALLPAPATAGGRHHDVRGGDDFAERMGDRHAERLTKALDLTEAQQQELDQLQDRLGDTLRPLFDTMRDNREALEELLDSANPDPAAVGTRAIELHRAKAQMKSAHESFESEIVAMLNETQRAQFEALREARGERGDRGDHFGSRRFDGPPHERD